jgi:hypothetical protein
MAVDALESFGRDNSESLVGLSEYLDQSGDGNPCRGTHSPESMGGCDPCPEVEITKGVDEAG